MAAPGPNVQLAGNRYVTVRVAGQPVGVAVARVRDVLRPHRVMPVPRAPRAVAGALNLRGRIVTAIDLGFCLGGSANPAPSRAMSLVVEVGGELYGLLVDQVGEVISPPADAFERNPPNLDARWRAVTDGVFLLENALLPILNVKRLIDGAALEAA